MKIPSTRIGAAAPIAIAALLASSQAQAAQDTKVQSPAPNMQDIKTPAPVLPAKAPVATAPGIPLQTLIAQNRAKLPAPIADANPAIDPNRVFFDQPGDGSLWTMGHSYKAEFSSSGATYFPNMGPSAPQLYPVSFRLTSAEVGGAPIGFASDVSATRAGDAVQYVRGGLTEVYEIRPESVEQEFVFASLPAAGDLVVRMSVATELAASNNARGFRFSNKLGHVDYSRAVAIDAAGHRVDALTTLDGGSLEIRVPASFVSDAVMPLTIDPVITTFTIDTSVSVDTSPDVSFDASNGRYLVCWERVYSATDHDVWAQQYDSNGALVANSGDYIDYTTSYWANPRCANNNIANNHLVVAQRGSASPRAIWGRTRDAASIAMGTQFAISSTPTYDCTVPDVGGDPVLAAPTYYLVTWMRDFAAGDTDVHAQMVDNTGALFGTTIFIDNSGATLEFLPTVSKSDGDAPYGTQNWTVTWTREYSAGSDYDIWGSQVRWDGAITHATYQIDFTGFYDYYSQASSIIDGATGERDYLTAYSRFDLVSQSDVNGRVYNGTTFVADANLTALDSTLGQDQVNVTVDSDGCNYAVAYSEQYSTSTFDYDVYVSTFSNVGGTIKCAEAHANLDFSTSQDVAPQIASVHSSGGSGAGSMAVWQNWTSTGFTDCNISGGIYANAEFTSYCSPGVDAMNCPCGNPPSGTGRGCNNSSNTGGAILSESGSASLSSDNVVFTATGEKPTATSIFLQGTAANVAGTGFGQGVRCVGGTLKRLYTKTAVGGVVTAPTGGDPDVSVRSAFLGDTIQAGQNRYYMVYYRDPIVLGGCSGTATYNATQSGALCWLP